jgi:hypothetical protein
MACLAAAQLTVLAVHAAAEERGSNRLSRRPMHLVRTEASGTVVSGNWSGYAVTSAAGSITSAIGSWIVPIATCGTGTERNTGTSDWVGIDGYSSRTVEQTGTDSDCDAGRPKYYAWYELYPKPGRTIATITVHPGDVMRASVIYANGKFKITTADTTTGKSFTISKMVAGAKRNSAEWIAEANATHLTDFGTVSFGQDLTAVANSCEVGVNGAAPAPLTADPDALKVHAIKMVGSSGTLGAAPGALSTDGTSFMVTWYAAD